MQPNNPDDLSTTISALHAILDVVHQQARTDANLRAHLSTLGHALCAMAGPTAGDTVPAPAAAMDSDAVAHEAAADSQGNSPDERTTAPTQSTPPPAAAPTSPPASREDIEKLQRAFQGHTYDAPATRSLTIVQAQDKSPDAATLLGTLSSDCAVKAARIRQRQMHEGLALAAMDNPGLYWLDKLLATAAAPAADWDMLAGAYEVVATLIETLADVLDDPELARYRQSGLEHAAEAQSALRAAVARIQLRPDPSQDAIFHWLRRRAEEDSIFIKRYMRIDDQADPVDWRARLERMVQWRESVESTIYRYRHERKLFGKLRYQLRQVPRGGAQAWTRALQTIEAIIAQGTPPSSRALRDLLWPHRTALAAEQKRSQSIALVAREIERARRLPIKRPQANASNNRAEPHIAQAADLLRGTTVVIIGGEYRPQVAQTIEDAFDLHALVWCDTRPHQSHMPLEPAITRAEVSVVLLAIRWASHGLGEVRTFCDRYQKPLVRLPGGYNVSQLAHQILQQASARLEAHATDDRAEAA
jgi:hypothetical protein